MKRVEKLTNHLRVENCASHASGSGDTNGPLKMDPSALLKMLEDRTDEPDRQRLLRELPGPHQRLGKEGALLAVNRSSLEGKNHLNWDKWAREAGSPSSNIVFPVGLTPKGGLPYLDCMVVINHPKDAQRIARANVRKSDTYGIAFLGDGVLATRDIDHWREQREHLTESFLPVASLSEIFPVSETRAKWSAEVKLREMCENGKASININEFFLFEAMAQLMLGLLGESEETMDGTNVALREAFKGALTLSSDLMEAAKQRSASRRTVHGYSNGLVERSFEKASGCPIHFGPSDHLRDPSKTVQGPLAARIADVDPNPKIKRDNASTFLFAGHDTTANLMTHFVYYMCKHPKWNELVTKEADEFVEYSKKNKVGYMDLQKLQVIKRCINETLRIAPSVPNGSFREVQLDTEIEGPNGTKVLLKKGTPIVCSVWGLHHNEDLWGPDVNEFNPDREWLPEEDWFGEGLRAWVPESYRYCPFTFKPRSCIGQPFANMEARLILVHLFHNFRFELAEPTKSKSDLSDISINLATLGPKDGLFVHAYPRR